MAGFCDVSETPETKENFLFRLINIICSKKICITKSVI